MLRSTKLTSAAFSLAACLTAAPSVFAQQRDAAAAQALFDEARGLMQAKRFAEACPKLEESQRLDPGIGTEFRLADCYEQQGKIASAWAGFLDVASVAGSSGQTDRQKAARARAARLESRLPHLTIVVPAASRAAGLEVRRDGTAVGEAQWGSSVPVDPGDHEIAVTAPGKRAFSSTVSLRESTPTTFTVPALDPEPGGGAAATASLPAPAPSTPAPEPAPAAPPAALAETPPAPSGSAGPGFAVIGLGGLGLVGIVVGTTFGVMASSKYDDSKRGCRDADVNVCSQHGVDLRNTAFTYGNVATVGFIVGGVALAGAATLWLTSSGSSDSKARTAGAPLRLRAGLETSPTRHGVVVAGSF
jgi:hypothetical protein